MTRFEKVQPELVASSGDWVKDDLSDWLALIQAMGDNSHLSSRGLSDSTAVHSPHA
eukprot:CAMPEP_0185778404 /NCGR_PEP_ID=MMETSP1174-20130828/92404_1 /TAXON_ID=35687 /ORGANISM="Dictyocha speculum, Strain CCMP1381" /LENGTH=55 /DNA_ID=CAMNT_0028467105 /DNA_START=453 /DNA_END=616 /DNA_ORIENTATION=+